MNKLSLTKKILATACAVAGLTFVGGSSEAADVDNQKSVLKPQNTLNIINDMNMRNTNPYFESINVVNSENSQVLKQIRNDKVSVIQDNSFSQTNGVLGLNNNVSARSLNVRNNNNSTITRMEGKLTGAAAPTPTLDDMQKEAKDNAVPNAKTYFNIESPYVLTEGQSTAATDTNISYNGQIYNYTTPTNLDSVKAAMLRYLSGSTAIAGALTTVGATATNSVFSIGGVNYTFATGNLPESVYTISEVQSTDTWNWTDGTKYYHMNFPGRKTNLVTITDTDPGTGAGKGSINISLPNEASRTVYYSYDSSKEDSDRVGDLSGNISGKVYKGISSTDNGGVINNTTTVGYSIIADFIGNSSSSPYGGAIYNEGTINSIMGDFIGNSASSTDAYGGAIYNGGTISSITGDFINNKSYV